MTFQRIFVSLSAAALMAAAFPMLSQAATTSAKAVAASSTVCSPCGTVTKVTAHSKRPKGSGVGLVAGAVVGGLVGNQFGHGSGNALATVGGAVAGGVAGNEIERGSKQRPTVYVTDIRMDDGTRREITLGHAFAVGTRVSVNGNHVVAKP